MTTITIPNSKIFQQAKELVLIPREEYESLICLKIKKIREANLTALQKKAIAKSEKELKSGEFFTINELEQYLARPFSKARS